MNQADQADFRVDLEVYRGPIDLLLYLVRRNELEIGQVSLARIAQQYLEMVEALEAIDFNLVGDFLEIASVLVETKMRSVLPNLEVDDEFDESDPRENLVQRLLLYKEFRDAASLLQEQGRHWHLRYSRIADDTPERKINVAHQPLKEIELWDLVSAFGRILRDNRIMAQENIIYDDTPMHVYMQRIHDQLVDQQRVSIFELFDAGMHKSALVGIFLAILELVRHHDVVAEQYDDHGEIWIRPGEQFRPDVDFAQYS